EVQPENHILAPSHAPSWVQNREFLWNEVERSETRKNSRLAREINIALPRELSNEQQTELIKGYVQEQFVDKGMIADIAIHRDDKENPHAHVMLTTREISEDGFTTKNRDWNNKKLLEQWREQWSEHANKALEKENIQERITHKSHADRGLEILPTVHLGHVASDMEKKGMETDRGNINRKVEQHNAIVYDLQKYREEKQQRQALSKEQEQKKAVAFTTGEQKVLD
ncbi:molybdopterin-guanine dinucleotide biosynthesis protein MobA, partial [Burkholderia multivorans]